MKVSIKVSIFVLTFIAVTQGFSQEKYRMKNYRGEALTPLQYQVTRDNGTEPAFHNAYWDNHHEGIYVDVISGEALFSSADKFNSGTGWPSFVKPIKKNQVIEKRDRSHGMARVEIRSAESDAHLGHVFTDGPQDRGGLRYCINSAALRFISKEKLVEEGYGEYLKLFVQGS